MIIVGLQILHRMRITPSNADFTLINKINSRSRLLVVDEAHNSIAPTYKATIDFICDLGNIRLIALTAIPGRTDEGQIANLVKFYGKLLPAVAAFWASRAWGADTKFAIANAYQAVAKISWDGVHYRKDIGRKSTYPFI